MVGRVPMDVANYVAALRSCCAVFPARPRVRIMTSSSMFADGTVGSTGAVVVSELEPGRAPQDLSVDPDHVQKGSHHFCHRPAEPETTADFAPTASAGPRQHYLKPTLLPTLSLGRRSARGRPLMARCTICAVYHRRVPALTGVDYVAVRHRRPHECKEGPLGFVRQPAAVTTPYWTFADGSVAPTGAVVQEQSGRFQRSGSYHRS